MGPPDIKEHGSHQLVGHRPVRCEAERERRVRLTDHRLQRRRERCSINKYACLIPAISGCGESLIDMGLNRSNGVNMPIHLSLMNGHKPEFISERLPEEDRVVAVSRRRRPFYSATG